jgi:hypothetical protein
MDDLMDKKGLERRLIDWAMEYGGGRYENIGYASRNILQTLMEHEGFVPSAGGYRSIPINTPADEIETAVRMMEATGYLRPGRVIRCEYFLPNAAMEVKLSNLERIGVAIKRPTYYDYLSIAKAFVVGQLTRQAA